MAAWTPDVHAVDFSDPGLVCLLIIQDPPAEVLPGLLQIAVIAAAIAAGASSFLDKL